jgi:hypothetical protein
MAILAKNSMAIPGLALALGAGAQAAPIFPSEMPAVCEFQERFDAPSASPWGMGASQSPYRAAWLALLRREAQGPANAGKEPGLAALAYVNYVDEGDEGAEGPAEPAFGNEERPPSRENPAVPEPGTLAMTGAGLLGLLAGGFVARRARRRR